MEEPKRPQGQLPGEVGSVAAGDRQFPELPPLAPQGGGGRRLCNDAGISPSEAKRRLVRQPQGAEGGKQKGTYTPDGEGYDGRQYVP